MVTNGTKYVLNAVSFTSFTILKCRKYLNLFLAMCNKMLDSTNCSEHDKTLFCKTCHARKFGPKGVGFGMGAGALNMDNGERQGNTDFVS